MPVDLYSSQRQMQFPALKLRKTVLCITGAAGLVIVCVFLLVFHGSSPLARDSSLEFPYLSATPKSRISTGDFHDIYNETLGVCTVPEEPSVMSLLTS